MVKVNIEKQTLNIIGDIYKHVLKKSWQCMIPNCTECAINSHLLMRHGVLTNVVENNHLYELRVHMPYAFKKGVFPAQFKRVGINDAISYPLFCNSHDTSVFFEIEHGEIDYSKYRNLLLFSYRALCAEIRKKEIEVEKLTRIIASTTLAATNGNQFSR